jgi:type IV pilus assembly protein PilV
MEALIGLQNRRSQRGALMIEVLITIVILAIGLAGLLQMQGRLQKSEMESYQRTQALMLANDMANRISTNRRVAASYVIGDPGIPTSAGCPADSATLQERDRAEWCDALQGAAEVESVTNKRVGALIGGRGCVYQYDGGSEYMVTVVWQGLTPISSPTVTCGKDLYDGGSKCINDLCRRSFSTVVRLGTLPP